MESLAVGMEGSDLKIMRIRAIRRIHRGDGVQCYIKHVCEVEVQTPQPKSDVENG